MPVRVLEQDRYFVWEISNSGDDETIIVATIGRAESMGLEVVAEGVGTLEQAQFLLNNNCHSHQGFLYYKPLDAGQIRKGLLTASPAANSALAELSAISPASSA